MLQANFTFHPSMYAISANHQMDDEELFFNSNQCLNNLTVNDNQKQATVHQTRGWFSAVRSKFHQITGMAEWLIQLGLAKNDDSCIDNASNLTQTTSTNTLDSNNDIGDFTSNAIEFQIEEGTCTLISEDFELWKNSQKQMITNIGDTLCFDALELQTFGPLTNLFPLNFQNSGGEHTFEAITLFNPTWCDKCGDFIWELLLKPAVKCKECQYTCHVKCRYLITLDCPNNKQELLTPSENDNLMFLSRSDKSEEQETDFWTMPSSNTFNLNTSKSFNLIEFEDSTSSSFVDKLSFNDNTMASQKSYEKIETVEQVVNSDSVEKIKIRIKLNLKRPINVVEKNETIQLGTGSPSLPIGTITSMYVPKNTSKLISVKGDVKSSRLITYLLTKLKVADNPRKFALYYHLKEDDERLKKVNDDELPCNLFELMKPIDDGLFEFVLQENDDSEISWVSFEVPELENFLKILEVQEVNHRQRLIEEKRALAFYLDIEIRDRERKKTLDII